MLAERRFTVVGCGSFGSALADMLVRAGAGALTLIDPEEFAPENLCRHVLTARDVGQPKVVALARRLHEINPDVRIEARQERFQDGDGVLLCCADSRRCESLVNSVSLARNIPSVFVGAYGAVRAGEVQIVVPGRTPCRECFAAFRQAEAPRTGPERYTDPDFDETRAPGQTGLWGSVLAVAGIAFHAVLALLEIRGRIDCDRTLWLVNLDYDGLPPYAVTMARIRRGCAVCDEGKIGELTLDDGAAAPGLSAL